MDAFLPNVSTVGYTCIVRLVEYHEILISGAVSRGDYIPVYRDSSEGMENKWKI